MSKKLNSTSTYDTDNESSTSDTSNDEIDWTGHIINDKYLVLNKLGKGSYCSVWNIYDIDTKNIYALKIYNIEDSDDGKEEKKILDQIKSFNISNIILYNKTFEYEYEDEDDTYFLMIMDQCGYSLNEIRKLFRDIVKIDKEINLNYILFINKIKNIIINILDHLHNKGFAHTDIKPENILVDIPRLESTILYERIKSEHNKLKKLKNKKILEELSKICKEIIEDITEIDEKNIINYLSSFNYNIKLCDFGTCLKFNDNTIYKKHTTYYKSPRIILKYPLDKNYDYWSMACTIYELITGEVLFNPFDENLILMYDDIEDINLMYLIASAIGMPSEDIINNSKVKDVIFTFDKKCIRGFKSISQYNYIKNMLSLETDINKNILYELIKFVINKLEY
jgi:serine/threonine protein kinase